MSVVQASVPLDRVASPLMSNNPFRNRVAPQKSPEPSPRPVSTNPFLDGDEVNKLAADNNNVTTPPADGLNKATDIFASMSIQEQSNDLQKTRSRPTNGAPRRPDAREDLSFRGFPRPPGTHRPSVAEEERRRQRIRAAELDIFADPQSQKGREKDQSKRSGRRNSDSSMLEKPAMDPEEEKKRRERKYRESKRAGTKSGKPSKKLDVIDKLDVTSIYGTGLFHHDGPFDACNPHRNRKREKYAPIQAFPKDSVNMVMGGSGPVNKSLDYDKFHGRGDEAHHDYNEAAIVEKPELYPRETKKQYAYDPTARETVHGEESVGLGTSTFLEGAPASRAAIQRRESEFETAQVEDRPGLSRKKSLAQKIRGVRPNRDRFASPEGRNGPASPPLSTPMTAQSESGANPFFQNFETEAKKPEPTIMFDEQAKIGRARAPSSPKRAQLERTNTGESVGAEENNSKPGGLLGRMKSLKGGKRPVRKDA